MVDPIGIKTAAVVDRRPVSVEVAPVTDQIKVDPIKMVEKQQKAETASTEISQSMAAEPPVDTDRVARIRRAIQEGSFPIYPSTIADRLLALKLEWNPNE